jgi:predicted nucleic-acid-binding protein
VIGLDANVLVRYFARDDPAQTQAAVKLIHSLSPADPGWIGLIALAELIWVLTRVYGIKKAGVLAVLETLLASQDVVVEQHEMARAGLRLYLSGNTDLPDCLIAVSAQAAGCTKTVTFDRKAARDTGMELLAP